MKKILEKLLILIVLVFVSFSASAQVPTYSCKAKNDVWVNAKVLQFDIFIYQTGNTPLFLNNYQLAFSLPNTGLAGQAGRVTGAYVTGTTQLSGLTPSNVVATVFGNQILLRVNGPTASLAGLRIPAEGLRVGTFTISSTSNFVKENLNLSWSNLGPYNTRVYALVDGNPKEITNVPAFHRTEFSSPGLTKPVAVAEQGMLGIGDESMSVSEAVVENYPNPFDNKTMVTFILPSNDNVTLEVYELSGKLLQTLYKGEAMAGKKYTTEFDGSTQPSGIYIYRLTTANGVVTGKMILNRD